MTSPCAESQRGRERLSPQEFDPRGKAGDDEGTDQGTFLISHLNSDPATPPRCATNARGPGASLHLGPSLSSAPLYERGLRALPKRNPSRTLWGANRGIHGWLGAHRKAPLLSRREATPRSVPNIESRQTNLLRRAYTRFEPQLSGGQPPVAHAPTPGSRAGPFPLLSPAGIIRREPPAAAPVRPKRESHFPGNSSFLASRVT